MDTPRIPRIQRALVAVGPGPLGLKPVAVPRSAPDEALVRTSAVALNPSDHRLLDQSTTVGAVSGADLAGTVVRLGCGPDGESHLKVGDRVLGFTFGANPGNPGNGAFSEYVAVVARLCVRLPDAMDFATAASLPMGIFTVGFIFRSLGFDLHPDSLPPPPLSSPTTPSNHKPTTGEFVLVNGGATATGTLTLQMLRLAGYRPIATCSPSTADLARSRGAIATFDYTSPTVRDEIREYTNERLQFAIDCIGTPETMALCYGAIGETGGKYVALEQHPRRLTIRRRDVAHYWVLGWTILGKEAKLAGAYHRPATPEDRSFGEEWAAKMEELLRRKQLEAHPLGLHGGGLPALIACLDQLRKGKVRGKKVVITI
ncbi:chaperonin 10-like protein [Cercophora scortea]|uniref:Chaperonin 10-like protein n=1 Tax=Cercophora scortea TaxID=314031 RepID=A0AAE0IVC2_9PEZI|nr:chaperonin 10-like protein [Cercophora scortea]